MSAEQGGYQADKVTVTVAGLVITGFDDGQFFTAKFAQDKVVEFEGADGYAAFAEKPAMRMGEITISVAQTSLANNALRLKNALPTSLPIASFNPKGGETVSMPRARLKKEPEITYSNKIEMRKYTYVGQMVMSPAGFADL